MGRRSRACGMGGTIWGRIERRVLVKVRSASELMWLRLLPSWDLFFPRQIFNSHGRLRTGGRCGVWYRGYHARGHVETREVGILGVIGEDGFPFRIS